MTKHVSKTLLAELKRQLEEKKIDLEEQLELLSAEDSYSDPDRTVGNAEEGDEATEDTSHLETKLKEKTATDFLGLVEKALAKIDRDSYGVCEVCGENIDIKRLEAFPEAPNCLEHA